MNSATSHANNVRATKKACVKVSSALNNMIGAVTNTSKGRAAKDTKIYATAHAKKIRTTAIASSTRDNEQSSIKVADAFNSMITAANSNYGSVTENFSKDGVTAHATKFGATGDTNKVT